MKELTRDAMQVLQDAIECWQDEGEYNTHYETWVRYDSGEERICTDEDAEIGYDRCEAAKKEITEKLGLMFY